MGNSGEAQLNKKNLKIAAIASSAAGFLILVMIANNNQLFLAGWFLATMFGLAAFVCAYVIGSDVLKAIAILVAVGFIFIWFGILINGANQSNSSSTTIFAEFNEPAHTSVINKTGSINTGYHKYVFFGNDENIGSDDFHKALKNVVEEDGKYIPSGYNETLFLINDQRIYYYDTLKMPKDEVYEVLTGLEIGEMPCLVRIESGSVVDYISAVDGNAEQYANELKRFFSESFE